MALNKFRLGDLIKLSEDKNANLKYGIDDVKGISIKKVFIETKADMQGVSLKPYLLVKPDDFAYVTVTSRNGEKITLAHNDTDNTYIVSSSYIVFRVKRPDLINSDFLFMYFNRPEFDRYSRFNSWGSARETFSWEDMCEIEIELPDIPTQEKYVKIYLSMLENQKNYEKGLDDLKLLCDGYIENLRRNKTQKIGDCIIELNERNTLLKAKNEMGISVKKVFIETKAKSSDLSNQKIVYKNQFAFNSNTSRNSDTLSIALNKDEPCAVSNTYIVFKTNEDILIPDYLYLWFKRREFDRYARFNSWGSARETISLNDLKNYDIAIPSISIQKDIVRVLTILDDRQHFVEKIKKIIVDLCPILIKGSIEEGRREA